MAAALAAALMANGVVCTPAGATDSDSDSDAGGLRATPYRPTVSNPADLPVPKHLEWEAGGLALDEHAGERLLSVPYVLKYAFNENLGVLVGGDSLVSDRTPGDTSEGWGDTSLVLKIRHPVSKSTALGLEVGAKLPTASSGLGSGHADFSLNGILSAEVDEFDVDVNLSYTQLGVSDPGTRRGVVGWAIAAAHAVGGPFGLAGEFSGSEQKGSPSPAQFLGALSYTLRPTIVLDCGSLLGLNHAAPRYGVFAGMTVLVP